MRICGWGGGRGGLGWNGSNFDASLTCRLRPSKVNHKLFENSEGPPQIVRNLRANTTLMIKCIVEGHCSKKDPRLHSLNSRLQQRPQQSPERYKRSKAETQGRCGPLLHRSLTTRSADCCRIVERGFLNPYLEPK